MPNGWLDPAKYERLNITSCTGPGTQYDGYAWSIVLHSTESPPGSIDGINSLFRSKPCYAPHFTIDPMGSRRRVQYIPWTWSACALRGGRDGYQTNRGRAVQVEKGMSGGIVMHLQELMIGMGYDCGSAGADGVFGDATDAAVRRLQADHGLTVDGIAGPQVNHVIAQAYAWANPRPTPPPPNPEAPPWPGRYFVLTQPMLSGDDVRLWQRRMQQRGWRIGIDGYYGLESLGCCKSFQSEKGLTVDGVVGPSTWNATWSAPIS
jgi:peptidoglycan hydrolase-like protein with peptidoglycan-binding domain